MVNKWEAICWTGIFMVMGSCSMYKSYNHAEVVKIAMERGYIEQPNPQNGDETIWVKEKK